MTRQFHARLRPRVQSPKTRVVGPFTVSFRCYRLVATDDGFETVELCDPRNAMRVLVCERPAPQVKRARRMSAPPVASRKAS